MTSLKWILDHNHHHGDAFNLESELCRCITSYYDGIAQNVLLNERYISNSLYYKIYPNFWSGYLPGRKRFDIGDLLIECTGDVAERQTFSVGLRHFTTGENVKAAFATDESLFSGVTGYFVKICENTGTDKYCSYRHDGIIHQNTLKMEGVAFDLKCSPVLCNWQLPFLLGHIIKNCEFENLEFGIFQDLELLLEGCVMRNMGCLEWDFSGFPSKKFRVICIHGRALEPSYWVTDIYGTVVAIITGFSTFVIASPEDKNEQT